MGSSAPPGPSTPPFTADREVIRAALRRPLALAGLRVLVVDDEPDARDLVEELLSSQGATVSCAASADEALAKLAPFGPNVVLSDIGMPGHDGHWLIARIRESHPKLPAVALTAFTRREDVARVLAAGFDEHVGKPVDPWLLVERIAQLRT
ncbi:MAG: response regulator [Deltaproteobacteria bacterium]|nr:response regulator [Deltaproteobacteria bacterium]